MYLPTQTSNLGPKGLHPDTCYSPSACLEVVERNVKVLGTGAAGGGGLISHLEYQCTHLQLRRA